MATTTPIAADERRRRIAGAIREPQAWDHVPFRGRYERMPLVMLPLELPLYRVDNGRIAVEQMAHVRERGLPRDFFRGGQESAQVQSVLHAMLLRLSKDPDGPIFEELERLGQQTEPLLLTTDGVVVNGNRRLAAMRALHEQDPDRYGGFAQVRCVVLPQDATLADIEGVEAALQMAPETKLAYGWVHRRLKLRRHRDELGLAVETICDRYRLEGPAQLRREIAELELAEEYLERYLGRPSEYGAVAEAGELFEGLGARLFELSARACETWKLAGFAMIYAAERLPHAPERYYPFAAPKPAYAPEAVLRRFGNEVGAWPEAHAESLTADDYALLAESLRPLDEAVANARLLTRLFDQVHLEHRERMAPRTVMKKVREASDLMSRVDLDAFDESQLRALRGQLVQIDYHARELLALADGREPSDNGERRAKLRKLVRDPVGFVADAYLKRRTKAGS